MTSTPLQFEIGQTVQLQDGRRAVVQYTGETRFAAGTWVGLELQAPTGKNDGAVQGQRYFHCETRHGIFVRPSAISIVGQATPVSSSSSSNGTGMEGNRTNVSVRPSTAESAGTAASRLVRPRVQSSSPPDPQPPTASARSSGSSATRTAVTSSRAVQSRPSTITRPSTLPAAAMARTLHSSVARIGATAHTGTSVNTTTRGGPQPPFRAGRAPSQHSRKSSSASNSSGSSRGTGQRGLDQRTSRSPPTNGTPNAPSPTSTSPLPPPGPTLGEPVTSTQLPSSLEANVATVGEPLTSAELPSPREAKVATVGEVVDKKQTADQDKPKTLEKVQAERDRFEAIIRKLEAKYQPQQQELAQLRSQLNDAEIKLQRAEIERAEHEIIVESAAMDREMAEHTAETLQSELATLKGRTEELELELEIAREERDLFAEGLPTEETSNLQLERNNEKLRDALIRLRDITKEEEAQSRAQVHNLQKEVQALSAVRDQYAVTKQQLIESEATVKDLQRQLQTALGAEDLVESLTQANMGLKEQLNELQSAHESLVGLKALNVDLEASHLDAQKVFQAEIARRDALLAEQARCVSQQEEVIKGHLHSLDRFRERVAELQTDLQNMRLSRQMTETGADELNHQSRAMLGLNMQLQVSASKNQAKTIELELLRLDAQQTAYQLHIADQYLPRQYQDDYGAVMTLLRFKRVSFTSELLYKLVRDRVVGHIAAGQEDRIFAGCEVLDKLTWISAMSDRLITGIETSSLQQLTLWEDAYYELSPVEQGLDGWLDGLKRDDIDIKQAASQSQGFVAIMAHLGDVLPMEGLPSYVRDVLMRALLIESAMDNTSTAMLRLKALIQSKIPTTEHNEDVANSFATKADLMVTNSRSAQIIATKVVEALVDLQEKSLSLSSDTLPLFQLCEHLSKGFAEWSRELGQTLFALLNEEGRTDPPTYEEAMALISSISSPILGSEAQDLFESTTPNFDTLLTTLGEIHNLTCDISQAIRFERPPTPWLLRGVELQMVAQIPDQIEEKVGTLTEALREHEAQLKQRDDSLYESGVKIQVLETRVRDSSKQTDKLIELEKTLTETRRREETLSVAVEKRDRELQALEAEREQWRTTAETLGTQDARNELSQLASSATNQSFLAALEGDIITLQKGLRYFQEDNGRLYSSTNWSVFAWLHTTLKKPATTLEELRANLLARETQDILQQVLRVVHADVSGQFDMHAHPTSRLTWRPVKTTAQWRVRRQHECWEYLREWKDDLLRKSNEMVAYRTALELEKATRRPTHPSSVEEDPPYTPRGLVDSAATKSYLGAMAETEEKKED